MMTNGYWFKSTLFEVELGEDELTNPFCYGKQLSEWIRNKFLTLGYDVEEVIEEDWVFCVMVQQAPFNLWVGCGSQRDEFYETITKEEKETFLPTKDQLHWHCFGVAEVPFWKKLFKKIDTSEALTQLNAELNEMLEQEREITITERP